MAVKQLEFSDERIDPAGRLQHIKANPFPISILLDNITDPRNLGAIFRLADACRVQMIFGYGEMEAVFQNKRLARYARSANNWIPFKYIPNLAELTKLMDQKSLVALEISDQSIPHQQFDPPRQFILVVGNERKGISQEVLDLCLHHIHIPMYGLNTSLNVAVATGIALYTMVEKLQWRE